MLIERELRMSADRVADPFDALFVREYPRVVAIASRVLLDRDAAEDVAQDVFVQYHRRHRPDAPFAGAWLHRAAVHAALNARRGALRRSKREGSSAALEAPLHIGSGSDADPLRQTVRAEERADVRRALARLSERSRAVLALRHSGLTYAETAAALGVTTGHIGTMLARAEAAFIKEIAHVAPR
jgi:RNA polymerase sigma factor (sigma-70 family)